IPAINAAITTNPFLLLPAGYAQYLVASEIPKQIAVNADNKLPNTYDVLKKHRRLIDPQDEPLFEKDKEKIRIKITSQKDFAAKRRLTALERRLHKMDVAALESQLHEIDC